jgi:hypothetical protein
MPRLTWLPIQVLVLGLVLLGAPEANAQRRKPARPQRVAYHDGSLEDALTEARERNAPLLILCCREDEEANDRFREQLRDNANLAAGVTNAIVVLANNGTHDRKKLRIKDESGKTRDVEVCEAYHTLTCEVHKRNWDAVYQTFFADEGDGAWPLPSALVVNPAGKRQTLIFNGQPPSNDEMLRALAAARAKAGPSLNRDELKRVKRLVAAGTSNSKAKLWPGAWHAWNGVLAITQRSAWAETAERGRKQAQEGLQTRVKELEVAGAAYSKLAWFAFETRGTPVEKQASELLKDHRKSPHFDKQAAKGVDLEIEAEGLLRQTKALLSAGDAKGAKRAHKRLMGKKYRETPAQREGRGLLGN